MRRFTQLIVAGGVVLLAGLWFLEGAAARRHLWLLEGAAASNHLWLIGSVLTLLGVGSICRGISRGLDRNSSR